MKTTSTAPPLPADLEELLRRLRLPHIRRHAPEVVATAKAQRWEPAEVLKALFAEEVAGRERSALATRRAAPLCTPPLLAASSPWLGDTRATVGRSLAGGRTPAHPL